MRQARGSTICWKGQRELDCGRGNTFETRESHSGLGGLLTSVVLVLCHRSYSFILGTWIVPGRRFYRIFFGEFVFPSDRLRSVFSRLVCCGLVSVCKSSQECIGASILSPTLSAVSQLVGVRLLISFRDSRNYFYGCIFMVDG